MIQRTFLYKENVYKNHIAFVETFAKGVALNSSLPCHYSPLGMIAAPPAVLGMTSGPKCVCAVARVRFTGHPERDTLVND